ncbi:MAG TPA: hypothetical protein VH599_18260 [Ktedonobacterales bacterium]|jgi:hypothetical protein
MLDIRLRTVDRVFARHPKSYLLCEGCLIHEAEVRAIWATPIYALSGAQVEWIVAQTGHFDNEAIRYYWPAILAHLVREPVLGDWWEPLFVRLYTYRQGFTSVERQAIEEVLVSLLAEPEVQPVEQAVIAAFLAFWVEDTALVCELVTESIQETWRQILAEPEPFGEWSDLDRLWNLAQLRLAPHGLRSVPLERCLLLEELLAGLCRPLALI